MYLGAEEPVGIVYYLATSRLKTLCFRPARNKMEFKTKAEDGRGGLEIQIPMLEMIRVFKTW